MSAWSRRARSTRGPAASRRSPRSCTPRSRMRCAPAASSGCGRTRPRRSTRRGPGRRSSRPARRRASRCASSCPRSTSSPRRPRARALPLPHQGARPGPGARAARARRRPRAPGDLRRRHPERAALGDPPQRERRAHEPGHAPPRDPAEPPRVGNFLSNLAIVVVDEAHVYRGVFGSHVGNVLRRLRRVAGAYGTEPRFLLASATIGNPGELAERLTGLDDFTVIERTARPATTARSRCGTRRSPTRSSRTRRSLLAEAADLLAELVVQGARTIVFMKSRKAVELMAKFAQLALEDIGRPKLAERIAPYRAGYTPQQRRELEHRLVEGELLGVVSTDALELGIDIGSLDAAICVTFPGTVASCARCGAAPGAAGAGWRSTSRARTRSTSSSAATPTSSSTARSRRRSSTTRTSRSTPRTSSAPRTRARWSRPTTSTSARLAATADGWCPPATCASARRHVRAAAPDEFPAADVVAALGRPRRRSRSSTPARASCSAPSTPRARHDHPRGRDLPARRALVRGGRARPRPAAGARPTVLRRLVHAAQEGDRHAHRAAARPPRDDGRDALVRHGRGHRAGARLPEQAHWPTTRRSTSSARPAADVVRHAGAVVRARAGAFSPTTSR